MRDITVGCNRIMDHAAAHSCTCIRNSQGRQSRTAEAIWKESSFNSQYKACLPRGSAQPVAHIHWHKYRESGSVVNLDRKGRVRNDLVRLSHASLASATRSARAQASSLDQNTFLDDESGEEDGMIHGDASSSMASSILEGGGAGSGVPHSSEFLLRMRKKTQGDTVPSEQEATGNFIMPQLLHYSLILFSSFM